MKYDSYEMYKKYEIVKKKHINCKNEERQEVQNYQTQKQLNSQKYKLALKSRFLSLRWGLNPLLRPKVPLD